MQETKAQSGDNVLRVAEACGAVVINESNSYRFQFQFQSFLETFAWKAHVSFAWWNAQSSKKRVTKQKA